MAGDVKLTKKQRETLEWLSTRPNGVDGSRDTRVVNSLLNKGLAYYSISEDAWFITYAGLSAIGLEDNCYCGGGAVSGHALGCPEDALRSQP